MICRASRCSAACSAGRDRHQKASDTSSHKTSCKMSQQSVKSQNKRRHLSGTSVRRANAPSRHSILSAKGNEGNHNRMLSQSLMLESEGNQICIYIYILFRIGVCKLHMYVYAISRVLLTSFLGYLRLLFSLLIQSFHFSHHFHCCFFYYST